MIRLLSVVGMLAFAGGCSSDPPEKPVASDAGSVNAPIVDAGTASPAIVDAGTASTPTVDAGAATAQVESVPANALGKPGVFDRILVKPKEAALSKEDAVAAAEKATKARVLEARKSVRVWYLLVFAPTEPARTAADQAKLIAQLKDTGVFASVEGDAVMKMK